MPKIETFKSDHSNTEIEPADVVTIVVVRVSDASTKTIIISDDELGDIMEESEMFGSLVLSD